jgi:Bacterial regulatory helix-turn-helix protein, lysR family
MTLDGRIFSGVTVLAAVVEGGSFVKAADLLGLTDSGVSRAIKRLETRLGDATVRIGASISLRETRGRTAWLLKADGEIDTLRNQIAEPAKVRAFIDFCIEVAREI